MPGENKIKYTVWDVETSIKSSFKRKGNPFDPENYIVSQGYRRNTGHNVNGPDGIVSEYWGKGPRPANYFTKLLADTRILVGFNIKFDVLHALNDPNPVIARENYLAWMEWVAGGGLVWDGQLAEYLLNGMTQADHMLSLDETAPRYGGDVKIDEVKALWQAGVDTVDIDPDLLKSYLCGRYSGPVWEQGDIGNTEVVWLGQYERAKACGQVKSILMNMGSLLCTIEMEHNGMAVDKQTGIAIAKDIENEVAELAVEVSHYLPKDLPFDFNWNSGKQKSALIFGGTVQYKKWLPHLTEDGQMQYAMKDEQHVEIQKLSGTTTMPLDEWIALDEAERPTAVRYAGGKNKGEFKTKKVKVPNLDKPKGAIQDVDYTFPGFTKPKAEWKTATDGVYQTGVDIILALGNRNIPFLKSLSKITSLRKDLTTYYITFDEKKGEVGMLTLVQADGIIHHMLNHTSTVTGRFSSSNPNLQNLPKGNKSKVKTLFVSRFSGGKVIQSDFSSLEVYCQAILTKCNQLIEDLRLGLDMHCVRVSQKEGISYEEALYRCKDATYEDHKAWSTKRTKAKEFSFQRAYGAGVAAIAESTGIPEEEVAALAEAERLRYPEVEAYYDDLNNQLDANSSPTNLFVQHPEIPGMTCNLRKSYFRTPDNKLYCWMQSPAPKWLAQRPASKGGKTTSFSPTQVKNYPVQGTGGEWAKAAMWLSVREFYRIKAFHFAALLVNQVHDALYADAMEQVALEAAVVLHACMEEASVFIEWYFGWQVPVPVPSETTWGTSMMDEGKMPEGFKEQVDEHRRIVRGLYMNNYQPAYGFNTMENKA
jgi:DNA polymerase-1